MAGKSFWLKTAKRAGLILIALPVLFALTAWIGSSIPRNGDWEQPGSGIDIMIGTNGIHTEIAMPLVTPHHDWRAVFPASDITDPARDYTHVAVSWGERAFFLETPSWTDLSPAVAINALTGGSGVLHVAHYVRPAPSDSYRTLRVRPEEYRKLVAQITAQLPPPGTGKTYGGYAGHDVFYEAQGTYHLGNTCNQWTSDNLANAGIMTGWWSPLSGGVMKWVPQDKLRGD